MTTLIRHRAERQPGGAARLILNVDRPRLLVEREELPRERRVVIDEGTHLYLLGTLLLRSHCTRRIRSGGVHQTAFLLFALREGDARNSAHSIRRGVPARGARGRLGRVSTRYWSSK